MRRRGASFAKRTLLAPPVPELVTNFSSGVSPFDEAQASVMAQAVVSRLREIEDPLTDQLRDVPGASDGGGGGKKSGCLPTACLGSGADARRRRGYSMYYDELADEVVQLYEQLDIAKRV